MLFQDFVYKELIELIPEVSLSKVSEQTLMLKLKRNSDLVFKDNIHFNKRKYSDKWSFYNLCKTHNILTPNTDLCLKDSALFKQRPIVLKKRNSSQGTDVFLIKNNEDLKENDQYIIQEPLLENSGEDFRILLINNKLIGSIKRKNINDFRANIHQGGVATKCYLPSYVLDQAIQITQLINFPGIAGIDVIFEKGNYYFIELNAAPAVKTFLSLFPSSHQIMKEEIGKIIKDNQITSFCIY